MFRQILILFLVLFSFACSHQTDRDYNQDIFQLPDSLFTLNNIKNTFFTDSLNEDLFVKLDSNQKKKLIVPMVISDLKMTNENYIMNNMEARFISVQRKIGSFVPITVWVSGGDYSALFYILLDQTFTPISYYRLNGGFCAGPIELDSMLEYCPIRHSFLNDNVIKSYSLTEFYIPDSIARPSIIDSVSYESKILVNGLIETRKVDSLRFYRSNQF